MQKRVMEEDFRKGEGRPQLLDLIPNERDWLVKEVSGGGKCFGGLSEEKKLELRLGLPGGEDWPEVKEKREEHSVVSSLSLGRYSKVSKSTGTNPSSVGAKRGFLDAVESKTEVFQQQQQQQPGFLQLQAKGKELSQKTNGRAELQSLEKKACGSPVAHGSAAAPCGGAAGANNSSQTR